MNRHVLAFAFVGLLSTAYTSALAQQGNPAAASATQLAEQNRVNREYYERLLAGPAGNRGVWLNTVDGKPQLVIRFSRNGDGYIKRIDYIGPDKTVRRIQAAAYRLDSARGVVLIDDEGQVDVVRYESEGPGRYRAEFLPALSNKGRDASSGTYVHGFEGSKWIFEAGGKMSVSYWLDEPEAVAALSGAANGRAWAPPPSIATSMATSSDHTGASAAAATVAPANLGAAPVSGQIISPAASAAAVPSPAAVNLGMLPKLIGTTFLYTHASGLDAAYRFEWIEPGRSIRVMSQIDSPWHEFFRFVPTSEPGTLQQVFADPGYPTQTLTVRDDGSLAYSYGVAWVFADGLLRTQYADGTVQTIYYPNTPEGLAGRPKQDEADRELAHLKELAAQVATQPDQRDVMAEIEADAQAKASAAAASWNANQGQSGQALADSLENLNNTVSNIQTQQQRAAARQRHAQAQSDQASSASLQVSSTPSNPSIPAASQPAPSGSNLGASEHLMGFLGATCEIATENARRHFGKGSSFRVAHSRPDGNMCLVQVDLDSVVRGASGAASEQ